MAVTQNWKPMVGVGVLGVTKLLVLLIPFVAHQSFVGFHREEKVSLNAFHVDVGEKAASAGSSSIRAALAGEVWKMWGLDSSWLMFACDGKKHNKVYVYK